MTSETLETQRADSVSSRWIVQDFYGSASIWIFPRVGPRSPILGVTANLVPPAEGFGSVTIEDFSESAEPEEVEEKTIELRIIPREQAIKLIKTYIDNHPGCLTSDIIFDLTLNPDLVLDMLRELQEKGEIEGEDIE